MTVRELREHLSFLDNPDEEIKMCHKGVIVPINTLVADEKFVFLDSAEYEPVEDAEVEEMSLGKTIQALASLSNLPPDTKVVIISKSELPHLPKLRLVKGES